jgi:hypothetical protein
VCACAGLRADIDRYHALHTATGVSEEGRADFEAQVDKWLLHVQALEQQVADATLFLPQYDNRQSTAQINDARTAVESLRSELLPRKKFTFSARAARRAAAAAKQAQQVAPACSFDAVVAASALSLSLSLSLLSLFLLLLLLLLL